MDPKNVHQIRHPTIDHLHNVKLSANCSILYLKAGCVRSFLINERNIGEVRHIEPTASFLDMKNVIRQNEQPDGSEFFLILQKQSLLNAPFLGRT